MAKAWAHDEYQVVRIPEHDIALLRARMLMLYQILWRDETRRNAMIGMSVFGLSGNCSDPIDVSSTGEVVKFYGTQCVLMKVLAEPWRQDQLRAKGLIAINVDRMFVGVFPFRKRSCHGFSFPVPTFIASIEAQFMSVVFSKRKHPNIAASLNIF